MFLDCERKPKHPEKTPADMERTYKLHTQSNPTTPCCEATVLTAMSPYHSDYNNAAISSGRITTWVPVLQQTNENYSHTADKSTKDYVSMGRSGSQNIE